MSNILETKTCRIELDDALRLKPWEMACLQFIADGALPSVYGKIPLYARRCERYKGIELMKYDVRTDDGSYTYFVYIDKTGIYDAGILVYQANGRQLERTDNGEILGWRTPRG